MKTKLFILFLLAGALAFAGPRVFFGVGIGNPYYGYAGSYPYGYYAARSGRSLRAVSRPRLFMGWRILASSGTALELARRLLGASPISRSLLGPAAVLRWPLLSRLLAAVVSDHYFGQSR